MKDRDREPLTPEIDTLLAAERSAPAPPVEARERMRRRIFATLGLAAGGGAVAATVAVTRGGGLLGRIAAWSLKTKVLVGLALGGTSVGLPVVAWQVYSAGKAQPALAPTQPATAPTALPPAVPRSPLPTAPTAPPAGHAIGATSPAPARSARADLAEEQALIERARSHLAHRQWEQALFALRQHHLRHSRGQLSEEREVLWIRTLITKGERRAAGERAERFRRAYPRSIFLPAIDGALAE